MTWVRFDDQYPIHDKVEDLTDAAYRLNTNAIFWCSRNTTDGFVRERKLTAILPRARNHGRLVDELVEAGLWEPIEGGWIVHDYLDYQPSKEKVEADRRAAAERQQKWRDKRVSNGVTNGASNGVTNSGSHTTPSRPVPVTADAVTKTRERAPATPRPSTTDQRIAQAQALKARFANRPDRREIEA